MLVKEFADFVAGSLVKSVIEPMAEFTRLYVWPDEEHSKLCTPNEAHKSVTDIDFRSLWELGYRGIIFDSDGTLRRYHAHSISPEITNKLEEIISLGYQMLILTNLPDEEQESNRKELEELLKIPVVAAHPKKPHPEAFRLALHAFNPKLNKSQVIVVGDRIFTDILGGNRVGIYTIFVNPFSNNGDPLNVAIARWYENLLYRK